MGATGGMGRKAGDGHPSRALLKPPSLGGWQGDTRHLSLTCSKAPTARIPTKALPRHTSPSARAGAPTPLPTAPHPSGALRMPRLRSGLLQLQHRLKGRRGSSSGCLQPALGSGRAPVPGIKPVPQGWHRGWWQQGSVHARQGNYSSTGKPAPSREPGEVTAKDERRRSKEKQG